eukprot:356038-Chlamydomonas_euryale.AAC.1
MDGLSASGGPGCTLACTTLPVKGTAPSYNQSKRSRFTTIRLVLAQARAKISLSGGDDDDDDLTTATPSH